MSLRTMSGYIQGNNVYNSRDNERKSIFTELMSIVKELQTKYGGKTELATETDLRIIKLCDTWEQALSYGLKTNSSVFQNVSDLVSGSSTNPPVFWEFAYNNLTGHEKERFSTLRQVWTDRGKGRSLIRAAFNERSMERYVRIWLSDSNLPNFYETWSLMRDDEMTSLLPSMAAGLGSILFAVTVDCPELNAPPKNRDFRPEPVIAVKCPVAPSKKINLIKRQIISFDEDGSVIGSKELSRSVPKSLPSMTEKYEETFKNQRYDSTENCFTETEDPTTIQIQFPAYEPTHCITEALLTPPNDSNVVEASEGSFISSLPSQNSSIHGSVNSVEADDVLGLKKRLRDQEERCDMLEARVAELNLENHRLRALTNFSRNSFLTFFTVSIPKVILKRSGSSKFYVYQIILIPNHGGDERSMLKRYSDFLKLHKKYEKLNISVKTLDFPPKKKFGNMDPIFVEQRRQRLQVYLRHLIAILPEVHDDDFFK